MKEAHLIRPEPFLDRVNEISAFERAWGRRGAGLAMLYGRRRLGKTYLLQRFLADLGEAETIASRRCYYVADQSTAETQRLALAERLLEAFPPSSLRPHEIAVSWTTLLRHFSAGAVVAQADGKAALVLDEFPYLVAQSPELPSVLQAWWDEEGAHAPVFVVLCGSQLSVMAALENQSAPLHGRFNAGRIRLEPMSYADVAEFYVGGAGYGPREKLLMYGAFGGTPRYHALVDPELPWDEQIVDLLLRPGAPFEGEARSLLASEQIRDPAPYNSILGAVARGCTRHGEIQNATGIHGAAMTHPLNVLQELEWVRKEMPFGETSDKRAIYRIADPFLLFWYRFGAPLASALRFEDPMIVFHERVEPLLADYMGWSIFEEVCAQWLRRRGWTDLGLSIGSMGRYWSHDGRTEIDIVAQLEDGRKLFGECKWSASTPVGTNVYTGLRSKVDGLPDAAWKQGAEYVLFSVGGFTEELRLIAKAEGRVLHLVDGELLF
jgi:AAA+ ATPase superfamily predicted ATPase